MSAEEWKPFPLDPRYEASSLGRIRNRRTGHVRKLAKLKNGYLTFVVSREGKHYCYYAHRAVAAAFIGDIPEGMHVCHNNRDKSDNRVENLRIDTVAGNSSDRLAHGTLIRGERVKASVLTEEQVVEIYESCESTAEIASRLGVPRAQVGRVRRGENWGWLTASLPPRPVMYGNLTADQIVDIYLSSESSKDLERRHSVSQATVSRIRNGKTWTEVTSEINKEVA